MQRRSGQELLHARPSSINRSWCSSRSQVMLPNFRHLCGRFSRGITLSSASSSGLRRLVLGIESTCDDTGAAVVDDRGQVLGEALHSQQRIHLDNGGIIPPIAHALHAKHIAEVVDTALREAGVKLRDLDAIAGAVKPGLPMSLVVGMNHGKKLCRESGKPFIPIHHMEAHALTIRMIEKIPFPFLALLISGGNCLLSLVRDVDDFALLGGSLDDGLGEAFDKTARRLKLKNLPEYATMGGGQAIEIVARQGNPEAFEFPLPMQKYRDCNFSFSGLKFTALKIIQREEAKHDILGGQVLPNIADICASFQLGVTRHLLKKLQRAVMYCEDNELLRPDNRILVVSGGVASNGFVRGALTKFCDKLEMRAVFPPVKLCTDNGVMIAWNGMERLLAGIGLTHDLDSVDIDADCPLGKNISRDIVEQDIKLTRIKLDIT